MAYINFNPKDYFNTLLWTGNSSTNSITGNDFQPDLVWTKVRSDVDSHVWLDTVRDAGTTLNQALVSNNSAVEGTMPSGTTVTVNSTGFDVSGTTGTTYNYNGSTYASWLWKAGGHTGSSNTDGSITSTVSANTTSGFSIVKYTGTGVSATVGHGLNTIPNFVIFKKLTVATNNWRVQTNVTGSWTRGYLDVTNAFDSPTFSATSTYVSIDSGSEWNSSGADYIMYCFNSVKGFSKFGAYTPASSAGSMFVYTGFKPLFTIIKPQNVGNWWMHNWKSQTYNENGKHLKVNSTDVEGDVVASVGIHSVSNGFYINAPSGSNYLHSGGEPYIYMCWAEHPLVSSTGTPCTAR